MTLFLTGENRGYEHEMKNQELYLKIEPILIAAGMCCGNFLKFLPFLSESLGFPYNEPDIMLQEN